VTHVPSDPLGIAVTQPGGDLLWAPLQLELVLHQVTQLGVGGEPPGPDPGTALLGPSVSQVAAVAAAIMHGRAAAQLTAHRRGRPPDQDRDLPHPQPPRTQRRDPLPIQQGQVPRRVHLLTVALRSQAAGLGTPPVTSLAANAELPTRHHRPNPDGDQPPVLVLQPQPALPTPSCHLNPHCRFAGQCCDESSNPPGKRGSIFDRR
jgi:hypothetical protein